jgi:predicted nucleotidyltransferase
MVMNPAAKMVDILRASLSDLLAIYMFGSQVQGETNRESDLDLAVLVAGRVDPLILWNLAQQLADQIKCEVDLIDLRATSTVMQYQIITTGKCLWQKDSQGSLYECVILSEKTALDTRRADLLADIQKTGKIYD